MLSDFEKLHLDEHHVLFVGRLPDQLRLGADGFERFWALHPDEHGEFRTPKGIWVPLPRWQQAYGRDYYFSGRTSHALPVPSELGPLLKWGRSSFESRLNGLLVNWYDARLGHYIGKHIDQKTDLFEGSPIVTVSFGEERPFRLRPKRGKGFIDFPARDGTVFMMPWETNLAWTHEVPHHCKHRGRRISVTLRAFEAHVRQAQDRENPQKVEN